MLSASLANFLLNPVTFKRQKLHVSCLITDYWATLQGSLYMQLNFTTAVAID